METLRDKKNLTTLYVKCFLVKEKEPEDVVDDLDPTEDGEASEETHRSSDEAKLGFQGHLLVLFHFVVGGGVKEDLNEVHLILIG